MRHFFGNLIKNRKKGISFIESLSVPANDIFSHLKDFILLSGMVAMIISFVTFLGGRSFFCGFGMGKFCYHSVISFILSLIVNLYVMAFFINRWHMIVVQNMSFMQVVKEKLWVKDLKAIGIILGYVFLWSIAGICTYILMQRVAMGSFAFELGFFVFFSAIIIICLLLLLNFVGFYHYLQGGPFFTFHKTVGRICDHLYTVLGMVFIYLLIFLFFIYQGEMFLIKNLQYGWIIQFLGEFYFYFIVCGVLAVFVSSFIYQEKNLFNLE